MIGQAPHAGRSRRTETVARALVRTLVHHGVDRLYCVAGESYLAVLDALYDTPAIDVVTCRHEGSAGFMAVADAKLTGRAAVCLVNRGPGATNASIAVHAAAQDATPLVLVVGHVETSEMGRDAFQELDCGQMFGGLTKGTWVLHDPDRAAELMARALRVAESGTPGATVIVLPEDLLSRPSAAASGVGAWRDPPVTPDEGTLDDLCELLGSARRPLVLAGARIATPAARVALRSASERHVLPVVTTNKHQHIFDNRHPYYAGHLHNATQKRQIAAFDRADLVLAVGTRLDEVATRRGRFPRAPVPEQPLVHVYPDPARLGLTHRPALGIACDPGELLRALAGRPVPAWPATREEWARELNTLEVERAGWRTRDSGDGGVMFGAVIAALDRVTDGEVVVSVDSGVFTSSVYRHLRFAPGGVLLGITSSAMGFGVPAAVAAALRLPGRRVVATVGDGGFLMSGAELATAVARKLRLVVIISNNGSYGTIRLHQERTYPGRRIATDLANPDFVRLAEAYGALGLAVRDEEEIEPALHRALDHPGPAVLDVRTSVSSLSPSAHLDGSPIERAATNGASASEVSDGRP